MKASTAAILLGSFILISRFLFAIPYPDDWDGNYLPLLNAPKERQPEELQVLLASAVSTSAEARNIAFQAWADGRHIRAYQTARVVRLFRRLTNLTSSHIGGIGSKLRWTWEVHLGPLSAVEGIVLVDAETKDAKVIFPISGK